MPKPPNKKIAQLNLRSEQLAPDPVPDTNYTRRHPAEFKGIHRKSTSRYMSAVTDKYDLSFRACLMYDIEPNFVWAAPRPEKEVWHPDNRIRLWWYHFRGGNMIACRDNHLEGIREPLLANIELIKAAETRDVTVTRGYAEVVVFLRTIEDDLADVYQSAVYRGIHNPPKFLELLHELEEYKGGVYLLRVKEVQAKYERGEIAIEETIP